MGIPNSKFQDKKLNSSNSSSDSAENSATCRLDPRSPTADISRTPVQLRNGNQVTITKQQNLNDTFSTPSKVQTKGMLNSLLRGRLGATIDLRSPSANVDRTPIVLDKKIEPDSKIVLEDVTDAISSIDLEPKKLDLDETELECSVELTPKSVNKDGTINSGKRKSYLETNVDCLETDLDAVTKPLKSIFNTPRFASDTFDPRSPSAEICRTPVLNQNDSLTENVTPIHNKITIVNEIDPRSVTKEIYRTPITLPVVDDEFLDSLQENSLIIPEDLSKSPGENNLLNLSTCDEVIEDKLIEKSTKLDEIKKDFAKKYGKNLKNNPVNQVYEDNKSYKVTPRKALSASGRTPLSCVRNKTAHLRSKSDISQENKHKPKLTATNDLRGSVRTPLSLRNIEDTNKKDIKLMINDLSCETSKQKSPKKYSKGVSKIPTFKPKSENTELRTDVWDKDSSVVI